MPFNKNYGFMFAASMNGAEAFTRTLAHELGHGAFGLEHPWIRFPELAKGQTNNLMDYGDSTKLHHYQWKYIENPRSHIGGGSDGEVEERITDSEAAYVISVVSPYFSEMIKEIGMSPDLSIPMVTSYRDSRMYQLLFQLMPKLHLETDLKKNIEGAISNRNKFENFICNLKNTDLIHIKEQNKNGKTIVLYLTEGTRRNKTIALNQDKIDAPYKIKRHQYTFKRAINTMENSLSENNLKINKDKPNGAIKLVGKNGNKIEIPIKGKGEIELYVDQEIEKNETIDLGVTALEDIAIGYQHTISGEVSGHGGVTGDLLANHVLFFDDKYGGYWYTFVGGQHGGSIRNVPAISLDAEISYLIGIKRPNKGYGPYAFQGYYAYSAGSTDYSKIRNTGIFGQVSVGTEWIVIEGGFSIGGDIVPSKKIKKSAVFGQGKVWCADEIIETNRRRNSEIIWNHIKYNPLFYPYKLMLGPLTVIP